MNLKALRNPTLLQVVVILLTGWLIYDSTASSIANKYHSLFYDSPDTWRKNRWFGIPNLQNPNDFWIIQETISELKPDVIVEAGAFQCGSALAWASMLQNVHPSGRVITIDIEDNCAAARKLPLFTERIQFILGSSTAESTLAQIRPQVTGKNVLVILDSDHSKDHVLRELKSYAPMVSKGNYLIVQDTNINGHPVLPKFGPGPTEALRDFLSTTEGKRFEIDKSRERLLFTMHPNGYLRAIQ